MKTDTALKIHHPLFSFVTRTALLTGEAQGHSDNGILWAPLRSRTGVGAVTGTGRMDHNTDASERGVFVQPLGQPRRTWRAGAGRFQK